MAHSPGKDVPRGHEQLHGGGQLIDITGAKVIRLYEHLPP